MSYYFNNWNGKEKKNQDFFYFFFFFCFKITFIFRIFIQYNGTAWDI